MISYKSAERALESVRYTIWLGFLISCGFTKILENEIKNVMRFNFVYLKVYPLSKVLRD